MRVGRVTTAPNGVETLHNPEVSSLTMALCRLRQLLHNTRYLRKAKVRLTF